MVVLALQNNFQRKMGQTGRVESEVEASIIKPVDFDELPPEFRKADKPFGIDIHIFNFVVDLVITHSCMAYCFLYLMPFGYVPAGAALIYFLYGYISGLGITVGCHRYWTHKTFKANKPFQVLLMFMQTASFQNTIFKWCRDHRVHHKFTDSDADPHSAARGFWFSHMTWLFQHRHPDCDKGMRTVEISDLVRDPIVRFQSKHFWELHLLIFHLIPMGIVLNFYPQISVFHLFVANMTRYGAVLHITFLVNSVAHILGDKPYDKFISPTENKWVSILAAGEGWHNYHHTFPWDYKAAEFGYKYNFSTAVIHFFAMIGWAWDLKTVSHKMLNDRVNRTGDGSHYLHKNDNSEAIDNHPGPVCWGWGDTDLRKEDIEITETVFPAKFPRG